MRHTRRGDAAFDRISVLLNDDMIGTFEFLFKKKQNCVKVEFKKEAYLDTLYSNNN